MLLGVQCEKQSRVIQRLLVQEVAVHFARSPPMSASVGECRRVSAVSGCRGVGGAASRDHPSSAVGVGFYPPLPEYKFIFSSNHLRVVHHDGFEWKHLQYDK